MAETLVNGGEPIAQPRETAPGRGLVASTSCLVVLLVAAFIVLVVLPMSLWLLGIACGGS